jgi:hypothetical protein
MRNILLIVFSLIIYLSTYAQDTYKATTLEIGARIESADCRNIDRYSKGFLCQTSLENKNFIYSSNNLGGYPYEIILDISADNSVVLENAHKAEPLDNFPLTACGFNDKIFVFTGQYFISNPKIHVFYKSPGADDWTASFFGQDYWLDRETCMTPSSIVYNGEMYYFFVDSIGTSTNNMLIFCYMNTEDGINWKPEHEIAFDAHGSIDINTQGNFSICNIKNKDDESCLMIAYTSKNNEIVVGYLQMNDISKNFDFIEKARYKDDNLIRLNILQGSLDRGPSGNIVQIFYTTGKKDVYTTNNYFKHLQWDIENEELTTLKTYSQQCSKIDPPSRMPIVFSDFVEDGNSNLFKKIGVGLIRLDCEKKSQSFSTEYIIHQYMDFLAWSSDEFQYQPSDDKYDSETDSSLWTLVGVLEGPPPFVLNGWSLTQDVDDENCLPTNERPVSTLKYGIMNTQTNEKESSFSAKVETEVKYKWFLFGASFFYNKETKDESEETVKISFEIEPVDEEPMGYYLFMKPTVYRRKYNVLDANGNQIDEFYIFKISGNHLSLLPYDLPSRGSLNPFDINTYILRDYPYHNYTSVFNHAFTAAIGSKEIVSYDVETTHSTEITKGFSISVGLEKKVPEIFKVKVEAELKWSWTTTVSATNGQNIEIFTDLPEDNPKASLSRDTIAYDGNFYWISYTEGKDNWWIPKGSVLSDQKPWCMTWEITGITPREKGSVLKVNIPLEKEPLAIHPNPANEEISIDFNLWKNSWVIISIYDISGNIISNILNENMIGGEHSVNFDTSALANGIYQCVIQCNKNILCENFIILK